MELFEWMDKRVKVQNMWDVGVLKLFCTTVGIIFGAFLSSFVIQYIWWFVVIGTILLIFLMYRLFTVKVESS